MAVSAGGNDGSGLKLKTRPIRTRGTTVGEAARVRASDSVGHVCPACARNEGKSSIAHLERSVSLTTRYLAMELPKVRFVLAKALRTAGRDPARARELAESARDALRAAHGWDEDIA